MNGKGELSNKRAPVVAINFETIFSKELSLKDRLFGDSLAKRFDDRYRTLTYKLYKGGYNVYIVSFNDISKYEDELWGNFIFFNHLEKIDGMKELYWNCKLNYDYYIDEVNSTLLLDNTYTLEKFLEELE